MHTADCSPPRALVLCGGWVAGWACSLRGRPWYAFDGGDVGTASAGCAGRGIDFESAASHECWTSRVQRMCAERRPLHPPSSAAKATLVSCPHVRCCHSVTMRIGSLFRPCTTRGASLHTQVWPDASSSPEEHLIADRPKSLTRCLVGGYNFRAICLMPVVWPVWGARFCRKRGACSHRLCSHVSVRMCSSHDKLEVMVEAARVQPLR